LRYRSTLLAVSCNLDTAVFAEKNVKRCVYITTCHLQLAKVVTGFQSLYHSKAVRKEGG